MKHLIKSLWEEIDNAGRARQFPKHGGGLTLAANSNVWTLALRRFCFHAVKLINLM